MYQWGAPAASLTHAISATAHLVAEISAYAWGVQWCICWSRQGVVANKLDLQSRPRTSERNTKEWRSVTSQQSLIALLCFLGLDGCKPTQTGHNPQACRNCIGLAIGSKKDRESRHAAKKLLHNVNPGITTPWLINRGVSPFSGDSSLLEGTPPKNGTGVLIRGQH